MTNVAKITNHSFASSLAGAIPDTRTAMQDLLDVVAPRNGDAPALNGALVAAASPAPSEHPTLPRTADTRGLAPTLLGSAVFFLSLAVVIALALYSIGDWERPSGTGDRPEVVGPSGAYTGVVPGDASGSDQLSAGLDGLSTWWSEWKRIAASILGVLIAFAACGLFARLHLAYTNPDRVDAQLYGELRTRLNSLDAMLRVLCPEEGPQICDDPTKLTCRSSCKEAWARRDFITDELGSRGSRWVLGSGFVDVYRHLHAAEEALFLVQPVHGLMSNAFYDDLRLTGADAAIPNASSLRACLQNAVAMLGGPSANLLPWSRGAGDAPAKRRMAPNADPAMGRMILREIRRAISEFGDDERAKLVRARNKLICTGTITAISGSALLALAMLLGATPEQVAGIVYYVVGAGVGLFSQLRADGECQGEAEDFGFSRARLFYVPVLSGLAAVGGVMVVAVLSESVDARDTGTQHALAAIFDVKEFSLGLVIAAMFGLTPSLLIERLQAEADDYRKALKQTSATAGAAAGGGKNAPLWRHPIGGEGWHGAVVEDGGRRGYRR